MADVTTLLISHDPKLIETVAEVIQSVRDLHLDILPDADEGLHHLEREDLALIIIHLPGSDSEETVVRLLQHLQSLQKAIPVIVILDIERPRESFTLTRLGSHCLSRPLDLPSLAMRIDVLTSQIRFELSSRLEAKINAQSVECLGDGDTFLYHPAEMGKTMERVKIVAPQDISILLTGETGTGKTRLAKLIHDLSNRKAEPFLVVNCGALSAHLIESEMFGHMRGAFTGADREHTGKFAEVGRGTLLLDEIDSLPLASQVKLLRAVEERIFEPVGSNKSLQMKARLIAASNKSLETEVQAGRFRSDLYYRLNVVAFHMPALRERTAVIRPLADKFIREFAVRNSRKVSGLSPDSLAAMERYAWPGNIRELRNVIEGAAAFCPGALIRLEDLPAKVVSRPETASASAESDSKPTLAETKEEAEMERILKALESTSGNRLRAAQELGISRVSLYKKLRKYGLL